MALVALGGAAPTPTAGEAPVMPWRGLTTATTKEHMKAFTATLPGNRAELAPGCLAKVLYRLVDKHLAMIILIGIDKESPCTDTLLRDLTAQYGEPKAANATQATGPFLGITGTLSRVDYSWHAEVRQVVLARMPWGYYLV